MTVIPDWVGAVLSILMGVSGLGMGFLDVLGVAYVFDGWRRAMPRSGQTWPYRYKILTGFVVAMTLSGVAILAPFTVARMNGATMAGTLNGWQWLWSICVIAAPYLLIGGIVTGQSGIVTVNHDASISTHDASIEKTAEKASVHVCGKCGASFSTLPELASHARWKHPKLVAEHSNGRAK